MHSIGIYFLPCIMQYDVAINALSSKSLDAQNNLYLKKYEIKPVASVEKYKFEFL